MKHKLTLLSLLLFGSFAMADTIVTRYPVKGDFLSYSNFVVKFRNPQGRTLTYSLGEIKSMEIEGLDEFNAAEALRTAKKYRDAIDKYEAAASRARENYKLLIRDRSYTTMQQAGMTGKAVKTWITITKAAKYTSASLGIVPTVFSARGNVENAAAIKELDRELTRLKNSDRNWKKAKDAGFVLVALKLKMAIATQEGNSDLVSATATAIQDLIRTAPKPDPNQPAIPTTTDPKPTVDTTFGSWIISMQTKKYTALINELTTAYPKLSQSRKAGALLMLGRAHLARSVTENAEKEDLRDAGLYFLAVYVENDESQHAPEALYTLAQINLKLGNTAGYRQVLNSLIEMYGYDNSSDWVKKARAEIAK